MTEALPAAHQQAYDRLHQAIQAVMDLPSTEPDETVTISPAGAVVTEYVVVALLNSLELMDSDRSQYGYVFRDANGRPIGQHVSRGLLDTCLGWLRERP